MFPKIASRDSEWFKLHGAWLWFPSRSQPRSHFRPKCDRDSANSFISPSLTLQRHSAYLQLSIPLMLEHRCIGQTAVVMWVRTVSFVSSVFRAERNPEITSRPNSPFCGDQTIKNPRHQVEGQFSSSYRCVMNNWVNYPESLCHSTQLETQFNIVIQIPKTEETYPNDLRYFASQMS